MPEICVIILNWNKAAETLRCLESLRQIQTDDVEIIVVDNGSNDDSAGLIRKSFEDVTCIETGANLGYAEGNNVGIRHALAKGARFIFVLNNDTEIAPDTLDRLKEAALQFPQAAFLGPKILCLENPAQIQSAGITLDYFWRSHHRNSGQQDCPSAAPPTLVDCISGAAIFIRAETLARIGLLDPSFFLYREEIDWCLRARRLGFQVLFVPEARVWHRSHELREEDLPRITYYMTRNSLLLIEKHRGGWIRLTVLLLRFIITFVSWAIRPRWRTKQSERKALLRGISDYLHHQFGRGPY